MSRSELSASLCRDSSGLSPGHPRRQLRSRKISATQIKRSATIERPPRLLLPLRPAAEGAFQQPAGPDGDRQEDHEEYSSCPAATSPQVRLGENDREDGKKDEVAAD